MPFMLVISEITIPIVIGLGRVFWELPYSRWLDKPNKKKGKEKS